MRYRLDVAYTDFAATVAAENAEMKQREEIAQLLASVGIESRRLLIRETVEATVAEESPQH